MMAVSTCPISSQRNACAVTAHSFPMEHAVVRSVYCKGTLGRNYYYSFNHALALRRRMELVFGQSKGQTHTFDLAEDRKN